jgi:hypothetical protein
MNNRCSSLCALLVFLSFLVVSVDPVQAALFPIATTSEGEEAFSAAFDGTNYLVGIQGDATHHAHITAQLVSQSGTLIGSRISMGRTGGAPWVAFDGTNYLVVWQDDATYPNDQLYGVFITKSGSIVNTPFAIDSAAIKEFGGIAFGGEKYLVVYYKTDTGAGKDRVYGRLISPSGTVGSEITISTGYGNQGFHTVAFDGTNFFVVWNNHADNTEVRGRFVSPSGTLGTELSVNANAYPNDNPLTVGFDGTNYLVLWTDEVSTGNWDVFGQLVSPTGSLVGGVISVSTASGQQFLPFVVFDGTHYLVTWTDMRNDTNGNWVCDTGEGTCWDIYGQYVSKTGALVGPPFVVNNDPGSQLGGIAGFANGKFFGLINTGISASPGHVTWGDVYGILMNSANPDTSILLSADWNFISFPRQPPASGVIATVLSPIAQDVVVMWGYDDAAKQWLEYRPGLQNPSLTTLAKNKGYWLYMNQADALDMASWSVITSTNMHLYGGWNLKGYSGIPHQDASYALSSIAGKWSIVWGWDSGIWSGRHPTIASFPSPILPLTFFDQRRAYWVKAKQETDWAPPPAPQEFPIAATTDHEFGISAAFDGTNYLVGIESAVGCEGDDQGCQSRITAQLVSGSTGALVGSRIEVGRTGGTPRMTFDGTNYLMVWPDDATANDRVYGQRVSKAGQLVGSPFLISQATGSERPNLVPAVFDGANYFVVWDSAPARNGCTDEYGQFVTPAGTLLGSPIKINTTPCGGGGAEATFDGTSILVTWGSEWNASGTQSVCWTDGSGYHCDLANIWGQFVTKSGTGTPGALSASNFLISRASVLYSKPLTVFDGTNYLVGFLQETTRPDACPTTGCKWDIYGQFVTTAGTPLGSKFPVSVSAPDHQWATLAWNGSQHLATWTEGFGSSSTLIKGRYFDTSGSPVGSEFTLFAPAGDGRAPWLAVTFANGASYFTLVNRGTPGVNPADINAYTNQDAYGAFITP